MDLFIIALVGIGIPHTILPAEMYLTLVLFGSLFLPLYLIYLGIQKIGDFIEKLGEQHRQKKIYKQNLKFLLKDKERYEKIFAEFLLEFNTDNIESLYENKDYKYHTERIEEISKDIQIIKNKLNG